MKTTSKLIILLLIIISLTISSCTKVENCPTISNLWATNISGNQVTLKWTASGTAPYAIQYRIQGTSTWSSASSSTDSLVLTGLNHTNNYEWQVKGTCGTAYSSSSIFTTGSCDPGYEGVNCMTETRAKYFGQWTANGTDNSTPPFTYNNTVFSLSAVSASVQKISFNIPSFSLQFNVTLESDGIHFMVDPFSQAGYSYSGDGTFMGTNTFTFTLNEVGPSSTTIYIFNGSK